MEKKEEGGQMGADVRGWGWGMDEEGEEDDRYGLNSPSATCFLIFLNGFTGWK